MTPEEFQRAQAATSQAVLLMVRRQWDRMDTIDDWSEIRERVTVLTAAGQKQVAERAITYTAAALDVAPVVDATPLIGVASDGRKLDTLLYSSVARARQVHTATADQMEFGRKWVAALAHTMIADAGRAAGGMQITATPGARWVRAVRPPCCQRCAVLAGKDADWNDAFERHPQCDCVNIPIRDGEAPPDGVIAEVAPGDIRDLTEAQRQAIEDGADMNQVINAKRRQSSDGMYTSEGVTKRGVYAKTWAEYSELNDLRFTPVLDPGAKRRRFAPARPTPERIYRLAQNRAPHLRQALPDREYAQALLARYGYIRRSSPLYQQALRTIT